MTSLTKQRITALACITSLWLGVPGLAVAAPAGTADELEAQAVAAFERKEYAETVELFKAAFDKSNNANYLYNIGRVYEEAGQLELARAFYERFVHAEGASLETRVLASDRLTQLAKILGPAKVENRVPPPSQVEPTTGEADKPERNKPTKLAITGWVVLGVGGVALVGSGVAGLLARRNNGLLEHEQGDSAISARNNGLKQALAGDILLGVGAAFAVTGIALVVADAVRRKKARRRSAALAPAFGRNLAGISLSGRF